MEQKVCCFIGHRNITVTKKLEETVYGVVEQLIVCCGVGVFLFGSKSQFDDLCRYVVSSLKEKYPYLKRVAYTARSEGCVLECEREQKEQRLSHFFNQSIRLTGVEEEFEHNSKYTAGKAGYIERNQAMIDASDYCVFYYDLEYKPKKRKVSKKAIDYYQPKSGTALAYAYAEKKKKNIINIKNF